MPAERMAEIVGPAAAAGRGVGAFNVIGIEQAEAIVAGAEAAAAPVVLQVSQNCVAYHGALGPLARACAAIAGSAAVPVALHLDHATGTELVAEAAGLGFGSVMYDASALPYGQNVRATAGAEQADRLHVGERQIERGDPGIDPLPGVLCRLLICIAVQLANIPAQYRPAESCRGRRVHLPRLGESLELPPEPLVAVGEVRELHSARGRQAPERRHQRSGIELRARVSAPDCRHTLFSGG